MMSTCSSLTGADTSGSSACGCSAMRDLRPGSLKRDGGESSSDTASRTLSRLSRRANGQLAENVEQPACRLLPGEVGQDVFARAAAFTVLPIDRAADRDGCVVDIRLPPVGTREKRL